VTDNQLTVILAERIMRWKVGPDRFLTGGRCWLPRWRFQPFQRMADASRLLEQAAPQDFAMGATDGGGFWARVRIAGVIGEAREPSQARALTVAVARALRFDIPEVEAFGRIPKRREPSRRNRDGT
jgi:hypothetical protein